MTHQEYHEQVRELQRRIQALEARMNTFEKQDQKLKTEIEKYYWLNAECTLLYDQKDRLEKIASEAIAHLSNVDPLKHAVWEEFMKLKEDDRYGHLLLKVSEVEQERDVALKRLNESQRLFYLARTRLSHHMEECHGPNDRGGTI